MTLGQGMIVDADTGLKKDGGRISIDLLIMSDETLIIVEICDDGMIKPLIYSKLNEKNNKTIP